ncbi:MAG: NAD(P)/FAD-dependent oxidoreductase [Myxococcales bacterium]|nr:NAD(P)/FAD-dependent oxidoreductase [Myxococcales bacterium]MDD9967927.1 NAD(P)/FAD-dependent oxidoreductase [Myxococcales bacterium]
MNAKPNPSHDRYDAIVVGARCAGAATALRMAQQGMRVLAIDRSAYGSDTRSTHALMRPAVHLLDSWGVLDRLKEAITPTVRTTAFYYDDEVIEVPIKPSGGVDGLYAPRRTLLDASLVDAARQCGAEVLHRVSVRGLLRDTNGRVSGVTLEGESGAHRELHAPLVIGADGVRSNVAGWVEAETYQPATRRTGGFYAYFRGIDRPGYHWYFLRQTGAGALPTNDGLTLVFVAVAPERFERAARGNHAERKAAFLRILQGCDASLAAEVAGAEQVGPLYGFPVAFGFHRSCSGPGWALVGDAGYFRDPLTAHGITDAFRDAELLARAAADGSPAALASYQATRDQLSQRFARITDEVAGLAWDTERIKVLHRDMSREMKRELEHLQQLSPLEQWPDARFTRANGPTTLGPLAIAQ